MRIQFCGADRTVTGSCHLIEVGGKRICLDVGMYQGPRDEARRLNHYLPDNPNTLDAVILSHAHLDHCGKLPVLTKAGYRGPIYCTPATGEISRIVLEDAARIQAENVEYLGKRSRGPGESVDTPLYGPEDIQGVIQLFQYVNYGQKTDLGGGVSFTFFNAGHILGSTYVVLEWTEDGKAERLLFTADVGRYDTPILPDPDVIPGVFGHVITESTYGMATHGPMSEVGPQLLETVKYCIDRKSRLIVPSFALGRTQTILWYIQQFIDQKKIGPIPIFVDSPMGVEISHVYSQFRDEYDEQTRESIGTRDLFGLSKAIFACSVEESKRINNQSGACVIIASSPTCEFGRVLHHLKVSIERPDDVALFVGWTPPGTLGRRLQDGQKRVRILDQWYDVRCQIRVLHGLSAHADGDELLRFLGPTLKKETTAYVVHGEAPQADGFAGRLIKAGVGKAFAPAIETVSQG